MNVFCIYSSKICRISTIFLTFTLRSSNMVVTLTAHPEHGELLVLIPPYETPWPIYGPWNVKEQNPHNTFSVFSRFAWWCSQRKLSKHNCQTDMHRTSLGRMLLFKNMNTIAIASPSIKTLHSVSTIHRLVHFSEPNALSNIYKVFQ